MRPPARLAATGLALLLAGCAAASRAPVERDAAPVPDPPPPVDLDLEPPEAPDLLPDLLRATWLRPRPRTHFGVRAPECARELRARRTESRIDRARRRLEGAWSFVYGETIGMAIVGADGRFVLQAVGGEKVVLRYDLVRAPGSGPGRLVFRPAPDSAASGAGTAAARAEAEGPGPLRALFKWRSAREVDLQVRPAGGAWPEGFGRDRYRLFRDVEEALRYLRRSHRIQRARARRYRTD